jgi:hypothetical protein
MTDFCYKIQKSPPGAVITPPTVKRPTHIILPGDAFTYALESTVMVGTYTNAELSGFREDGVYKPAVFASDFNNRILNYPGEVAVNSSIGQIKILLDITFDASSHFKIEFNW